MNSVVVVALGKPTEGSMISLYLQAIALGEVVYFMFYGLKHGSMLEACAPLLFLCHMLQFCWLYAKPSFFCLL